MRRWRKVRRADIPDQLRDKSEIYGEFILANALVNNSAAVYAHGLEFVSLLQEKRPQIMAWLNERRDLAARLEDRTETVEWAILIFAIVGVIATAVIVAHDLGWLRHLD